MAIDAFLIGFNSSGTNSVTTAATNASVGGSGNHGVLFVSYDPATTITGISDNKGNTWPVGAPEWNITTGGARLACYKLLNWVGGSGHQVTVTCGATTYLTGHLIEVRDAESASAVDVLVSGTVTGTANTPIAGTSRWQRASGALSQAAEVILYCLEANSGSNGNYTSPDLTILSQQPDANDYWTSGVGKIVVSSTSSNTGTIDVAGRNATTSAFGVISFKQASAPTGLDGGGVAKASGSATLTVLVALVGSGATRATSTAALTVRVAATGAGAALSRGDGALSVAAALTGSGRVVSSGSGSINTGSMLNGAGRVVAGGQGALTVRAALAGLGLAQAGGLGSLASPGAVLSGAGVAAAAGQGVLAVRVPLAGTGRVLATGAALLAVPFRSPDLLGNPSAWWLKARFAMQDAGGAALAGAGRVVATSLGVLQVRAVLAGAGVALARGQAQLTVRAALAGTGLARAGGTGALNSGPVLNGTGLASAGGQGALTVRAELSGTGSAAAAGTAALNGGGVQLVGTGSAGSRSQADLLAQHAALQAIAEARASSAAALQVMAALTGAGLASASGRGVLPSGGGDAEVPEHVFRIATSSRIFRLATVTRVNEKAGA